MSIIRASSLSTSDLALLGNNVRRDSRLPHRIRSGRREIKAVNRSLAISGERVSSLHRPLRIAV